MANIQLLSNPPWAPYGYGTQCAQLTRQLLAHEHDVLVQADTMPFGAPLTWEGVPVCPGFAAGVSPVAVDMTGYYASRHNSDLVLLVLDVFGANCQPQHLKNLECQAAWWVPVDAMPLGATTRAYIEASKVFPLAMSRFGEEVLKRADLSPLYVPHAIDTGLFSPQPELARKQARTALGITPDTFVVGVNAANQHPYRKGWFEVFYGFRTFLSEHPDSVLLAWTLKDGRPVGLNLEAVAALTGISNNVIFRDAGDHAAGIASQDDLVAQFYAACDILANCSWAEGFGLAPLEAQACGIPVVVTDFSAMGEVAAPGEHGAWKIPSSPVIAPDHTAALWGRPQLGGIMEAFRQAYAERDEGVLYLRGEAARQHALGYDHRTVYELYWQFVLDRLLG